MRVPGKFRLNYKIPTLSQRKVTKGLREQSSIMLREATRAWLKAAVLTIPTYTVTARGTMKPLGRFLRVAVPNVPRASAKDAQRTSRTYEGRFYSLGFDQGGKYSDYKLELGPRKFVFTFVQELGWAEFFSEEWRTYEEGEIAFKNTIRIQAPRRFSKVLSDALSRQVIKV